jgi:hypothetical protein
VEKELCVLSKVQLTRSAAVSKSQAVAVSYPPARVLRMSKFSLANATPGTKRTESQAMGAPSKIPKVSQLKKEAPREKSERVVTNGPLKICIRRYSDRAGDLWAQFKDQEDTPLYQIQMEHDARPSVTINLVAQFHSVYTHMQMYTHTQIPS